MSIAIPTSNQVPQPLFKLRWRFDFLDRPSRRGIWLGNGREDDSAWCVNKRGLIRAAIEAESILTQEIQTLLEIDGHEYATAEWDAYSRMPGFYKGNSALKPRTIICGLSFLTKNERLTVFVDGSIKRRPLTRHELGFFKKEHSV